MNSRDRKKLRQQEIPDKCPACEEIHEQRFDWMVRMREQNAALEVKLNQERLANAQLRATLKSLTGK